MRERNNFTLDVISDIDEEIIDKNLKRRHDLWAKKGQRRPMRFVPVIAAAACLCIIVSTVLWMWLGKDPSATPTPDGKQVPIYKGMTVSNEAPDVNGALFAEKEAQTVEMLSSPLYKNDGIVLIDEENSDNNGNHYGNDKDKENEKENDAPEVFGGTYYAMKNEDIYIHVHLSNPDDFEILSFTLNGEKYSSNMFEYGSNLELLILKCNVGNVDGLQEYTIDAIKYIDGEKIKDVRMDGDRTVKVYVNDDTQALNFGAELIGFELVINPTWSDEFTGEKKITSLSLWKDEEKLRDLNTSTTVIDGLPTGERLILKATYNDGGEEKTAQYIFDTRKQSEGLSVVNGVVMGVGTCSDTVLYINMPVSADAFANTRHIEKVYLGSGVTYIGEYSFMGSQSLSEVVFSPGAQVIKERAFQSCSELKSVVLPNTLVEIGASAFAWCSTLSQINFPDSIVTIGKGAFDSCTSLTIVKIPRSVEIVLKDVFYGCSSIQEITITTKTTTISSMAFSFLTSLNKINYNGTVEMWEAIVKELSSPSVGSFGGAWDFESGNYTVYCTDGEITKSGQVTYY